MNSGFIQKEYITDFKPGYGTDRVVWAKPAMSKYAYEVYLLEGKWRTYPKKSSQPIYATSALDAAKGAWAVDNGGKQ